MISMSNLPQENVGNRFYSTLSHWGMIEIMQLQVIAAPEWMCQPRVTPTPDPDDQVWDDVAAAQSNEDEADGQLA